MGELQVDQLRIMARLHGDAVGYRDLDGGGSLTFGEWDAQSNRLARGLVEHGVAVGDRVAIHLTADHILEWIVAYAAIHKAGAVAVPVNTRLSPRELRTIAAHAEISLIVTCAALADEEVRAVLDELTSLRFVVAVDEIPGVAHWTSLFADDATDLQVEVGDGDLADIMYTSGTTGLPKGVAVRHRNVALLPNGEVPWSGDGWLHSSPPFTFAGLSFVYNPMKLGMAGLFQARFDAGRWFSYVEAQRPTACFLVPSMARLLVSHPRWPTADLDSLTLVSVGSAPLPNETLVALCDRLPRAVVTNGYGMTEAGPAYCTITKDEVLHRLGSVGKPMPPMEVRIVDPATGDDLPAGERGEILIRARGRQREYYRDPEATAAAWTTDGWLHSGDIGELDDDGFLYVVGRMKEIIIRGGNNIHATDVESVLYEHPGVLEAAVVGVPHEVLGEDVAAFVVPRPGSVLDADDIGTFCRQRLADYKCPRRITILDELPRNATGKVVKRQLVDRAPT